MIGLSIDAIKVGDRAELTRRVSDVDIASFVSSVGDYITGAELSINGGLFM